MEKKQEYDIMQERGALIREIERRIREMSTEQLRRAERYIEKICR